MEETERNMAMRELANRQHGNIIRDESTRVKEGVAELGTENEQDSARLLGGNKVDFNANYKYTPKDTKLPGIKANQEAQESIEEANKDDEWELEDAEPEEVPLAEKTAKITIEVEAPAPEPSEKLVSEKPSALNFHSRG